MDMTFPSVFGRYPTSHIVKGHGKGEWEKGGAAILPSIPHVHAALTFRLRSRTPKQLARRGSLTSALVHLWQKPQCYAALKCDLAGAISDLI